LLLFNRRNSAKMAKFEFLIEIALHEMPVDRKAIADVPCPRRGM
jgi:hypothetical protein